MDSFLRGLEWLWQGFVSIANGLQYFSIIPNHKPIKLGTWEDDKKALESDWEKIGKDFNIT